MLFRQNINTRITPMIVCILFWFYQFLIIFRDGCEVLCEELREFIPFVYRIQNGSQVIERLEFGIKQLSQYEINYQLS